MSFWYETVRETCSCGASIELPYDTGTNHKIDEWRREHRHDKPRPELKSLKSYGKYALPGLDGGAR